MKAKNSVDVTKSELYLIKSYTQVNFVKYFKIHLLSQIRQEIKEFSSQLLRLVNMSSVQG